MTSPSKLSQKEQLDLLNNNICGTTAAKYKSKKEKKRKQKIKAYQKGYRLEREIMLRLEYNGYYAVRKYRSWGIEDIVAFYPLANQFMNWAYFIQVKNTKKGEKSMSYDELQELKEYAEKHNAIGVFAYSEKGKIHFRKLQGNPYLDMPKYTKEWYQERMKTKRNGKSHGAIA